MRIECPQCSAAYAVDDRLITPRGIRAQCPRCKHVQAVRQEEAPPSAPPTVAPIEVAPEVRCSGCGVPLDDPFDRALGNCDACRAAQEPSEVPSEAVPEEAPPPRTVTPLDSRVRSAQRPGATGPSKKRSTRLIPGLAVASVIAAAGGVGGVWLLPSREEQKPVATPAVPPEIRAVLPGWELAFLDVSGNPGALIASAQARLLEDRPSASADAREGFQKALLLDPTRDEAVAGYVRALAAERGSRLSTASFEEAKRLIRAASNRGGRTPDEALAHAELLLTRTRDPASLAEARGLAEAALADAEVNAQRARAHVVIGRTWIQASGPLAVKSFDEALAYAPQDGRALLYRALAHDAAGDHLGAVADLKARLSADPLHEEANAQLARIYLEAGRAELARAVYERILAERPQDVRARLPLAVFAYQIDGTLPLAVAQLHALEAERENFEPQDALRILTHLAAAERLAGRDESAVEAASHALQIDAEDPAAHLTLLLRSLERALPSDAETHLGAVHGRLGDAALEGVLEGRVRMLQARWAEALAAFDGASGDPRWRAQALLLAGIAAAEVGRRDEAIRFLFEAARSDPTRAGSGAVVTDLYVRPAELLRGFEGRIRALAEGADQVSPRLYEGVYRYHLGELAEARALFRSALAIDGRNALASAWAAFAALEQGEVRPALALGRSARQFGRQEAVAQLAHGAAALASGDHDEARRSLNEALRLDPTLAAAEQRLAELEAKVGELNAARERLRGIIRRDPSYLAARRMLFSLETEDTGEGAGPG